MYHKIFLEDLCFSLILITELICMKIRSLFHRDSLDPDVFLCEVIILFVTLRWLWQNGGDDKQRVMTCARDKHLQLMASD